jgi:hypothetical protein
MGIGIDFNLAGRLLLIGYGIEIKRVEENPTFSETTKILIVKSIYKNWTKETSSMCNINRNLKEDEKKNYIK